MGTTTLDLASLSSSQVAALRKALLTPKYELIPLKNVVEQSSHLPDGAEVSVTASPAKGIWATIELATELKSRNFDVTPHLSARLIRDHRELGTILETLDDAGITKAFVVGGDAMDHGEFFDGLALLTAMEHLGHGLTEIGIPGYPEGHHIVDSRTIDLAILAKAPYASWITTQMCFQPNAIDEWVTGLRTSGLGLGVYLGIPGVAELTKLITLSMRIGVGPSASFLAKNRSLAGKLVRPGGYSPDDLVVRLAPLIADPTANILGFHVYTFNQVEMFEQWRSDMLQGLD